MDFKKLGESVAHAALDKTMDGKNIGEIAESAVETALEVVTEELDPSVGGESSPSNPTSYPSVSNSQETLILKIVKIAFSFILKLFK